MTIFACFGSMINIGDLMIILSVALGIEAIVLGGIAFVISKVIKIGMKRILGAGAIMLLLCGTIIIPLGWEVAAVLTISGSVVCGCLLALGWLIDMIKGERRASDVEILSILIPDAPSTIESTN